MTAQPKTIDHETENAVTILPEPAREVTPFTLLDRALSMGADPATLREFMELQREHRRDKAKMAFDAAMAEAKADIPVIVKNRRVGYEHKDGKGETAYRHEDLGEIARTVDPILAKHGLSYRFRTTSEINQPVTVTCIVAHRDGHSEENTLSAGKDDSGKKNSIQAIGSTITYLQRYTLKAALGLAAAADDDGASSEFESISADQLAELQKFINDNDAEPSKILEREGVATLGDIPAKRFDELMIALKGWARQKKAPAS